jgi:hypothetical protein
VCCFVSHLEPESLILLNTLCAALSPTWNHSHILLNTLCAALSPTWNQSHSYYLTRFMLLCLPLGTTVTYYLTRFVLLCLPLGTTVTYYLTRFVLLCLPLGTTVTYYLTRSVLLLCSLAPEWMKRTTIRKWETPPTSRPSGRHQLTSSSSKLMVLTQTPDRQSCSSLARTVNKHYLHAAYNVLVRQPYLSFYPHQFISYPQVQWGTNMLRTHGHLTVVPKVFICLCT